MIAGPELFQDRTHILELLLHHPDVVERDLVLIERDVELGGRLLLDGLMRDASGRATLLFVVGRGEQAEFPARVVESVLWVRDNLSVLRRYLGDSGIRWEIPCRCLILCQEGDPALMRRLETLAGIDLDLMELRSIRLRNQNCWAAVPRFSLGDGAAAVARAVQGNQPAVSAEMRSLWTSLLDRLARIDRDLMLDTDRYSAEVSWRGARLARLRLRPAEVAVELLHTDGSLDGDLAMVKDERGAASLLDRVLRRFLVLQAQSRPRLVSGAAPVSAEAPGNRDPRTADPIERRLGTDPDVAPVRSLGASAMS